MGKKTLSILIFSGALVFSISMAASAQTNFLPESAQITNAFGVGVSSALPMPARHRACFVLTRSLWRGAQGDDVMSVQEFLRDEGLFSATPTGFFGPITEEALRQWQAREGIVASGNAATTGWGRLGPRTLERIKIWCGGSGGGWVNRERFSANPTRGDAPLTVIFSTWIPGFRPNTISYSIDFGDGFREPAQNCNAPADACITPGQNAHTYATNGTYTATLNKIVDPCAGQPACRAAIQSEVVAKEQIFVGPIACTLEYNPVCGAKPIVCITTPCNPVPTTYGNRCQMNADGATFLYEGACHDASGNRPPVISSFSGPTTLQVKEKGSWTIAASDPENGPLSYRIDWGDTGASPLAALMRPVWDGAFTQATTFEHAYDSAGFYIVTIVVRDNAGNTTKTTSTVRVEREFVACTLQYDPVCGEPPEPACRKATPACLMPTPGPTTYSNRCFMNAAGATFLYQGECQTRPVACTADAMQCSDGSWVGRTGPNCEFKCPGSR